MFRGACLRRSAGAKARAGRRCLRSLLRAAPPARDVASAWCPMVRPRGPGALLGAYLPQRPTPSLTSAGGVRNPWPGGCYPAPRAGPRGTPRRFPLRYGATRQRAPAGRFASRPCTPVRLVCFGRLLVVVPPAESPKALNERARPTDRAALWLDAGELPWRCSTRGSSRGLRGTGSPRMTGRPSARSNAGGRWDLADWSDAPPPILARSKITPSPCSPARRNRQRGGGRPRIARGAVMKDFLAPGRGEARRAAGRPQKPLLRSSRPWQADSARLPRRALRVGRAGRARAAGAEACHCRRRMGDGPIPDAATAASGLCPRMSANSTPQTTSRRKFIDVAVSQRTRRGSLSILSDFPTPPLGPPLSAETCTLATPDT